MISYKIYPTAHSFFTTRYLKLFFILFSISFALLPTTTVAHQTGLAITKQVNGSYKSAMIANFRPFHNPTVFVNTALIFSSPRSAALSLNHECFEVTIGSSFQVIGAALDLSTGFQRYWGGNSQSLPDGYIDSTNTASLTWSW